MSNFELLVVPPGRNYFDPPETMGRAGDIDGAVNLLSSAMGLWQNYTWTRRVRTEITAMQSQIQANLARNPSVTGVLVVVQLRVSYRQGTMLPPEVSFVSAFIAGMGPSASSTVGEWTSRPQMTTNGANPPNPCHGGGEFIKQIYFWCTRN